MLTKPVTYFRKTLGQSFAMHYARFLWQFNDGSGCTMRHHRKDGTDKTSQWHQDDTGGQFPLDERPSKRQKRGRYVSKACDVCQKRKIKCDGKMPCRGCALRGVECNRQSTDMRRRGLTGVTEAMEPASPPCPGPEAAMDQQDRTTVKHMSDRLNRMEHQLNFLVSSMSHGRDKVGALGFNRPAYSRRDYMDLGADQMLYPGIRNSPQSPVLNFSGETSIAYMLNQVEGYLTHLEYGGTSIHASASPSSHLNEAPGSGTQIHIGSILNMFDIEPERRSWDEYLDTYLSEIHILYPTIHPPTLREYYTNMWDQYLHPQPSALGYDIGRFTVAQVWICLAIGRCTQSPRIHGEDCRHSAGWSLYDAAMYLIGDLFSSFQETSNPVLVLQTLLLMVIYFFRLDANERAEKMLALAITHSHHLGLHRKSVIEAMSAYNDEMARRLWWCLYPMDRRLAIETGHPFLIHDVNVDVPLPRHISDDWLTRLRDDPRKSHEIEDDIRTEATRPCLTTIPFMKAMIMYSRVVGKVWKSMYGVGKTESEPNPLLCEYLEQQVFQAQREVQTEFAQHPENMDLQTNSAPWWRVKQRMLMHIRWHSLRLLIRKPMLQQAASCLGSAPDNVENEVTCMHVAHSIIQEFDRIPKERARSIFPFLHYFVTATMISLGLIIKKVSFKAAYGDTTVQAARKLKSYCHETWISGRMVRAIYRLDQMAVHVLENTDRASYSRQNHGQGNDPVDLTDAHPGLNNESALPPQDPQESSLDYSNDALGFSGTRQSRHDIWPQGFPNVVMTDFDFEETIASNTGLSYISDGRTPCDSSNVLLPQITTPAMSASNIEMERLHGTPSAILPEQRPILLPSGTQNDASLIGDASESELDWLQSLFCNSVGSYS